MKINALKLKKNQYEDVIVTYGNFVIGRLIKLDDKGDFTYEVESDNEVSTLRYYDYLYDKHRKAGQNQSLNDSEYKCNTLYEGKKMLFDYLEYVISKNNYSKEFEAYLKNKKSKSKTNKCVFNFTVTDKQYYPTPKEITGKMYSKIDWKKVTTILEPNAGSGSLIENIHNVEKYSCRWNWKENIDCCEIDSNLRYTLEGKGYTVVYDDFLTYSTYKHYDLYLMNPPFANGVMHLLKAISLAENNGGGQIACLINKQTIENPHTNARRDLLNKIRKYSGKIYDFGKCFKKAIRKADVEVYMVFINIPLPPVHSNIWEDLEKAKKENEINNTTSTLAVNDDINNLIVQYNMETEAVKRLANEIIALNQQCLVPLNLQYGNRDVITSKYKFSNEIIEEIRLKYWKALFDKPVFTKGLTNNLLESYRSNILEMEVYEFNRYNIERLLARLKAELKQTLEDTLLELFDKFTSEYTWFPESQNNIHYYNGWKTNKAHKIGKKVIIPSYCFKTSFFTDTKVLDPYLMVRELLDIEKAFNYLDSETGLTYDSKLAEICTKAAADNQTRNIEFKYFTVTFYKKGTMHITFNCPDIIKAFNIYAGQRKSWLPPSYGKKSYSNMTEEEKKVVDDFQGKADYTVMMNDKSKFLFNSEQTLLPASI